MADAKKLKLEHETDPFVRVALDEAILTAEEREDLQNNYEISCQMLNVDFSNFGSSDSDSSPVYYEDKKKHQILLRLKETKEKNLATISDLAKHGPPSSWNKVALDFYKIFQVSTYIVDPNYMFCSRERCRSGRNNMDSLLREIGWTKRKSLPQWDTVRNNLVTFLDVFDGCEDLPDLLIRPSKAVAVLLKFIRNVEDAIKDEASAAREMLMEVRFFAKKLLLHLQAPGGIRGGSEKYVQLYITILLNYFFFIGLQLAHSTPLILGKQSTSLDLLFPNEEVVTLPIEPDLQVRLGNKYCLVGEIRGWGCHGRDDWTEKHRGHRVDLDSPPATSKGKPMANTKQLSEEEVLQLKMKYRNVTEKEPWVDARGSSGDARSEKHECNMCSQTLQADDMLFQPYRDLDLVEEYKVSHFLPQLLAGMFACMEEDEIMTMGGIGENVRFGFSVVGFKLRLVRLVIHRDASSYSRQPIMKDIAHQRIKCETMAQEFADLTLHPEEDQPECQEIIFQKEGMECPACLG